MNTLYILRSVSGAGKSTLANKFVNNGLVDVHYEADMWFYNEEGDYNFDASKLGKAHEWCKLQTEAAMNAELDICVSNTFTTEKELQPYLDLAKEYDYDIVSLIVENRHGNKDIHNVPEAIRKSQEQRLKSNLKLV